MQVASENPQKRRQFHRESLGVTFRTGTYFWQFLGAHKDPESNTGRIVITGSSPSFWYVTQTITRIQTYYISLFLSQAEENRCCCFRFVRC